MQFYMHIQTSMARTSLGPWKFIQDMGSLSHLRFIIVPGQGSKWV